MKDNKFSQNTMEINPNLTKKQRKIARVKKIILESASELFSNSTYESVSMNDIADHAALSRATLYNYFKTKEDIFFEIAILKIEEIIEEQKILLNSTNSGLEGVLSIYKSVAESLLERPFHHKTIEMFFHRLDELNIFEIFVNSLLSGKDDFEIKTNLESYEEHIKNIIKAYLGYQNLLNSELRRGKEDGSIKCTLNDYELFSLTNIIYLGMGDFLNLKLFRRNGNEVIKNIINLLEKILTNQIQLK